MHFLNSQQKGKTSAFDGLNTLQVLKEFASYNEIVHHSLGSYVRKSELFLGQRSSICIRQAGFWSSLYIISDWNKLIPATLCEVNNYIHNPHWETKLERVTTLGLQRTFPFSNSSSALSCIFVSVLQTLLVLNIRACKIRNQFFYCDIENALIFLNLKGLVLLCVHLENWTTWTSASYLNRKMG